MIYRDFQGQKLSLLGFGAMRLPMTDGIIDEPQVHDMIRYAMENGVNYFDTAFPYHSGDSERVLGRALKAFPRDSFYLATKFPGHQIADRYDPAATFELQLEKCGVEYFDFYLLHNVYENSIKTYMDPRWGIIDYLLEQRRLGRIRHLGFSTHAGLSCMREFLNKYGNEMEFCQIQLNYVDWTLQDARQKCIMLAQYGIPVWVMEPVHGGKLANLPPDAEAQLKALRPDESIASWAFRWLQDIPNVDVILSGMSNMEQMKDNIRTFSDFRPLSPEENAVLMQLAESMKNSIPCTACRYCCDGCPQGLNIPDLLTSYNDLRFALTFNVSMRIEAMDPGKRPSACIGCGQCSSVCPQKIDIPTVLKEFSDQLTTMPTWVDISRQREKEQH